MFATVFLSSLSMYLVGGFFIQEPTVLAYCSRHNQSDYDTLPDTVDWRIEGHVSPVKDQGLCNACWAFAVVGTIESHGDIYLRNKRILSEQFLLDCLPSSPGCSPASILQVYGEIVSTLGGVLASSDYPSYDGRKNRCRWDTYSSEPAEVSNPSQRPAIIVKGFERIMPNNEMEMALFVWKYGPVTAAINPASMEKYKGNYIDEPTPAECDPNDLTHTVTVVGYSEYVGSHGENVKYWIIKNSWGEEWGDKGYYYLVRGRNACGIASDVSIPHVAESKNLRSL